MALVLAAKDSSDTWAAIAHVIRNMLLNWLVFAPLLASVLLIPQIIQSILLWWRYSTDKGGSILDALWHSSTSFAGSWDPHTWLDGLGVIVIMFGIGNSMVMRSGPGVTDAVFARWVLTPVIIGIFFLVAQVTYLAPPRLAADPVDHPADRAVDAGICGIGASSLNLPRYRWGRRQRR